MSIAVANKQPTDWNSSAVVQQSSVWRYVRTQKSFYLKLWH